MSPSEPIFDEATLTLKVRLEAANPQRTLKPVGDAVERHAHDGDRRVAEEDESPAGSQEAR